MVEDGFKILQTEQEGGSVIKHFSGEINVIRVPVEKIQANPYQPRKDFEPEALEDLAASIAEYGVLQPLLVARGNDDNFLLIAGERRLRASKMAGLLDVPVIVSSYTEQQIAEIALIENLQREDLHFLEEAEGYEKLMTQFNLTQEAMAVRVGKKQSTIANKLRLLNLPLEIRNTLKEAQLTERHGRALLKLKNSELQEQVLKQIIKNGWNVKQTEEHIAKLLDDAAPKQKKRLVIVNDVRIYLNSVKKIVSTINDAGIPAQIKQELDGDDVVVTLRIKNTKKPQIASNQVMLKTGANFASVFLFACKFYKIYFAAGQRYVTIKIRKSS